MELRLSKLEYKKKAIIISVDDQLPIKFSELGFIPNNVVFIVDRSAIKRSICININNTIFAFDLQFASLIQIQPLDESY